MEPYHHRELRTLLQTKVYAPAKSKDKVLVIKHDAKLQALLRTLGFPREFELSDAMCISSKWLDLSIKKIQLENAESLLKLILQKVMACDFQCRYDLTKENINPVDAILALILCSDNFLRQELMSKLAKCQLSIPFILPDPFTQQLTIPLWAMRSITKEFNASPGGTGKIIHIIKHEMPFLSFTRFGKHQKYSKSKIMNEIINNSHYDHFFHRDCRGGQHDLLLGNGYVDMCWYLPGAGGELDVMFPDPVTFLNLHGDARDYPQQVKILSQVSSMCFVLLSEDDLEFDEKSTDVLKMLSHSLGGVTVLVEIGKNKVVWSKLKNMKEKMNNIHFIDLSEKNMLKIIWNKIKKALGKMTTNKLQCIEFVTKNVSHESDIIMDEDEFDIAARIEKLISECKDTAVVNILPLQGDGLWKSWAALIREEYRHINRGDKKIPDYTAEIKASKDRIQKKQLECIESLTPLIKLFVESLLSFGGPYNKTSRNYFLQSLKLELEKLSNEIISKLQHDYKFVLHELQSDIQDAKQIEDLKTRKSKLQKQILDSSLGLEHLLREVGQIYEVATLSGYGKDVLRLPKAAAELFVDGWPLEIMDGDASHVPLKWIFSVLQEAAKMLEDPKVFVLSVLGLQSTGKSTLLNTVFGLQFNVGAGRCTRGAFMQLLPLDEELKKETKCNYVLVVDTEGLRAPAFDPQEAQRHDNELATFVIGLANMTFININGEVPGDMDDILQTSVHAFLRMKEVNLTPSVQFVHQNTTAANLKSAVGDSAFAQKLNKFAVLAAQEEHCEKKYKCFSDVIKFNEQTDVHHFPALWKGDPPMAPVNPGYSNAAQKLKHYFINLLKCSTLNSGCQNMSKLGQKIKDLWLNLLKEDFVFSFKNTFEVIAYKELETEWSQKWRWPFHKAMLEWEQCAENEIAAYDLKSIDVLIESKCKELTQIVPKIYSKIKKNMDDFFEREESVKYLHWKTKFYFMLSTLSSDLELQAKTRCSDLGKTRKAMSKYDYEQTEHIRKVKKSVQEYIAHIKCSGVRQSDQGIEEKFNEFWTQLMKQVFSASQNCIDVHVEHEVVENLLDYKADYKVNLQEKLKKVKWGFETPTQLSNHFPDVKQRKIITLEILEKAKKEVHDRIIFYYPASILSLLESIEYMIDQDLAAHEIASTLDFKLDIFLIACRYAISKFKEMVDPQQLYLEKKVKGVLLTRFKNQCYQVKAEAAIANTLCASLEQPIKMQVTRALGTIMVGQMKDSEHQYFNSKMALKAKILKDIREKDEFDEYIEYMENVKQCLEKWVKIYTKEYCDMEVSEGITRLQKAAQKQVTVLVRVIENKVREINVTDLRNWLQKFCEDEILLRELGLQLTPDDLIEEYESSHNLNLDNFQDSIRQGLEELKLKLHDYFSQITCRTRKMSSSTENLYNILKSTIVGCTEQCPFCGEQCDLLDSHAGDHRTAIHRPTCMAGYKGIDTKVMWTDFCPTLIASNRTFRNEKTERKLYGYRVYRKFYPDWNIPQDLRFQDCLYWKWFVARYKEQIAEKYSGKTPDVPPQWLEASKSDLTMYLDQVYHVPSAHMD